MRDYKQKIEYNLNITKVHFENLENIIYIIDRKIRIIFKKKKITPFNFDSPKI